MTRPDAPVYQLERKEVLPSEFFANWYRHNGRWFPWRDPRVTPFGVLVAELLLKQTRAEMVAGVWPILMSSYTHAHALAKARIPDVIALVGCLGFGNQRARALVEASQAVVELELLPSSTGELMKIPYVGVYTAHAVACFGFGVRVPVVDLNVLRVLSRLAGLEVPSDIRRAPQVWEVSWALLPAEHFKEHNYGLLDFAAAVCKARSPACASCTASKRCEYGKYSGTPDGAEPGYACSAPRAGS